MKAMALLLAATAALSLAACSQKDAKSPVPPEKQAAGANPLTAPVDYLGAVAKAKKSAGRTVDAASLNQAIQLFHAQEDRFPKSLDELVSRGYLPKLPTAMDGMKIVYDPVRGEARIVKP